MGTVTTMPRGRAMTRDDLDAMPDDGRRHELIDGTLVVTPAPSRWHQKVLVNILLLLSESRPGELDVMVAPFDVTLGDDTVVQPDLLVAPRSSFTDRDLPVAPLLAVEILSPSTRRIDLTLKRARYQAAGCPSYWVVDPDALSLTAWDLREGRYVEVADVSGEEKFHATAPYDVVITPGRLLD